MVVQRTNMKEGKATIKFENKFASNPFFPANRSRDSNHRPQTLVRNHRHLNTKPGHTFYENLKLVVSDYTLLKIRLQGQHDGKQEFVTFIKSTASVAKSR